MNLIGCLDTPTEGRIEVGGRAIGTLANDPTLVLADEPTGNLDTETGAEIMALFEELNREGTTILLVSHERTVAEHADHVLHLVDGRIEDVERLGDVRDVTAETVGDGADDGPRTGDERRPDASEADGSGTGVREEP